MCIWEHRENAARRVGRGFLGRVGCRPVSSGETKWQEEAPTTGLSENVDEREELGMT